MILLLQKEQICTFTHLACVIQSKENDKITSKRLKFFSSYRLKTMQYIKIVKKSGKKSNLSVRDLSTYYLNSLYWRRVLTPSYSSILNSICNKPNVFSIEVFSFQFYSSLDFKVIYRFIYRGSKPIRLCFR